MAHHKRRRSKPRKASDAPEPSFSDFLRSLPTTPIRKLTAKDIQDIVAGIIASRNS